MHPGNGLTVTNYILRPVSLCVEKKIIINFPLIMIRGAHLNKEYEAAMQIESPGTGLTTLQFTFAPSESVQVAMFRLE